MELVKLLSPVWNIAQWVFAFLTFLFLFLSCACRYAAAVQDGSQYFVLLIITDGVISDMAQTKEAIVNVRTRVAHKQCPSFPFYSVNWWVCVCAPVFLHCFQHRLSFSLHQMAGGLSFCSFIGVCVVVPPPSLPQAGRRHRTPSRLDLKGICDCYSKH